MSLVVDRYELGPIGTNCYVVRASQTADEAVVIDPGGDAADLRLELARLGARCVAILITHGHWDHLGGVAELAEGTGAPVYMAEDERALLENLPDLVPPGTPARSYTADRFLAGDETLELAGIRFETCVCPAIRPDTSPSTPRTASSPATCSSQGRSGARISRERITTRSSSRCAC